MDAKEEAMLTGPAEQKADFTDTLKTWTDDRPVAEVDDRSVHEQPPAAALAEVTPLDEAVARHQPPEESPVREFADHMDRAQQAIKDWVRKEIGLLTQNKSHDERVKENP